MRNFLRPIETRLDKVARHAAIGIGGVGGPNDRSNDRLRFKFRPLAEPRLEKRV